MPPINAEKRYIPALRNRGVREDRKSLIYVTDRSLYPLQIILREIVLQNSASSETGDPNEVNVIQVLIKYCVIMMSIIPMMVLYPFIQKYFVSGVMIGSIKG